MGDFLGIDLTGYDADLSQAFNGGNIQVNIGVFEQMKEFTKNEVLKKLK